MLKGGTSMCAAFEFASSSSRLGKELYCSVMIRRCWAFTDLQLKAGEYLHIPGAVKDH